MSKHNPATYDDPVNCPICSEMALEITLPTNEPIVPAYMVAVNLYTGETRGFQTMFVRKDMFNEFARQRNRCNYN